MAWGAAGDARGRHSNAHCLRLGQLNGCDRQQIFHGAGEVPGERELGSSEDYRGLGRPLDYDRWPFCRQLSDARHSDGLLSLSI